MPQCFLPMKARTRTHRDTKVCLFLYRSTALTVATTANIFLFDNTGCIGVSMAHSNETRVTLMTIHSLNNQAIGFLKSNVILGPHGLTRRHYLPFISPQLDTSQNGKNTDTGLVHYVLCPFTPMQLPLIFINQ